MKRKFLIGLLIFALSIGTASAQLGSGIVYDPTNYQNAVLRYQQLQQHLIELRRATPRLPTNSTWPCRWRSSSRDAGPLPALFSQWRNVTSLNTFGNTGSWVSGINSGLLPTISTGYQKSTTQLLPYGTVFLVKQDHP